MLAAGWHVHGLHAPGKFLVSAPEHGTPRRARADLLTDDDVARTVAQHAQAGRAIQVNRGRWRATTTDDPR